MSKQLTDVPLDGRLDELLDEIYQDKNTLGDLPLDRNLAKEVILALMEQQIVEGRIGNIEGFLRRLFMYPPYNTPFGRKYRHKALKDLAELKKVLGKNDLGVGTEGLNDIL